MTFAEDPLAKHCEIRHWWANNREAGSSLIENKPDRPSSLPAKLWKLVAQNNSVHLIDFSESA